MLNLKGVFLFRYRGEVDLMYTFKFEAEVRNGVINIPENYLSHLDDKVKVIIMTEDINNQIMTSNFNSISINTKEFKFEREVANER